MHTPNTSVKPGGHACGDSGGLAGGGHLPSTGCRPVATQIRSSGSRQPLAPGRPLGSPRGSRRQKGMNAQLSAKAVVSSRQWGGTPHQKGTELASSLVLIRRSPPGTLHPSIGSAARKSIMPSLDGSQLNRPLAPIAAQALVPEKARRDAKAKNARSRLKKLRTVLSQDQMNQRENFCSARAGWGGRMRACSFENSIESRRRLCNFRRAKC